MRVTVLSGLTFGLLWIVAKMIFFWTGALGTDLVPLVLLNMLFLLLAISVGLFLHKRREAEPGNALLDIKNAMSAGVPYLIVVSVFLYFYYEKIDPEFNQHQIAEAYTSVEKRLSDPEGFAEIKASNEAFEVMTKDEILAELKENLERNYSPSFTMTVSLLGLLLLSTINSIFVTIIYRRLIFRN
ncbi:MAG: DUF4199 domain-containing protein [Bacteroidetes bacterium]|nr:MAG: DUF4199 domain-containing protein [Bacteroidota bacterium]